VHLLGYLFEHRDPDFLSLLEDLKAERRARVSRILEKLAHLGVDLTFEEVEQAASGDALGRPHVASALKEAGHVATVSQAFDRYIGNRAPAYVGRSLLSLEAGIEAVRRAGGVSVLAHPGVYQDWAKVERILQLPVHGVEVCHPSHKKAERKRANKLGGKYNKILTGGSDFHGPRGDYNELGSSPVKERVVDKLLEATQGERNVVK
jgi:predicted metal-dependent phosphoesterase TrpH